MAVTDRIVLRVEGDARGKSRPKFGRGRVYTPRTTVDAERDWQMAWLVAGQPRLPDGAFSMVITINVRRPASHTRANGQLSGEGLRHPEPTSRPDIDNVIKLCADALNGLAYRDDASMVRVYVQRRWAESASVRVELTSLAPAQSA